MGRRGALYSGKSTARGGGLLICWTTCALLLKHFSLALKQLKHVEVAQ